MALQPLPPESHRCQACVYVIGGVPVQVPLFAVTVSPARAPPEIFGSAEFCGAAAVTGCAANGVARTTPPPRTQHAASFRSFQNGSAFIVSLLRPRAVMLARCRGTCLAPMG